MRIDPFNSFLPPGFASDLNLFPSACHAQSFSNVKIWLQEIDRYAPEQIAVLLVGNKIDLEDEREVTTQQVRTQWGQWVG